MTITIKKYPNRRLYDTSSSQYINLEAIKAMVMAHKEFEVVDSKTGENLTKTILLQIISESETNEQQSVLTDSLLKQLIRFYGGDLQPFLRPYLEQSLAAFIEQQESMQSMVKNFSSPMNLFGKMMEQNMEMWAGKNKGRDKDPQ